MPFVVRHMNDETPKLETFGEFIFYAYAAMQAVVATVQAGKSEYDRTSLKIRTKAFNAYKSGEWKINDLFINNVWKMKQGDFCFYCMKRMPRKYLTIEHVFPRSKQGTDDINNIVMVCKSCNSSKHDADLLEWYSKTRKEWPLPPVVVYYLKHIYLYAVKHDLMNKSAEYIDSISLPFDYHYIPLHYPGSYLLKVFNAIKNKDLRPDNPNAYYPPRNPF